MTIAGPLGEERPLGEEQADGKPHERRRAYARELCLRLLTVRARTAAELTDRLRRRDVPEEDIADTLTALARSGLVDDEAFARAWVLERTRTRSLARGALSGELRRRGITPELATAAVAALDEESELARARAFAEARIPRLAGLPTATVTRRLTGLLARRGYPPGLIARVVADVVGERLSDPA